MAKEEHLEQLKQGVEHWNTWREQNQDIQPDLVGANLRLAELRWVNFREAHLRGANLYGASLSKADLYQSDLSEANLSRAYLGRADLTLANLNRANLEEADLSEADLCFADLSGANLSRASVFYTVFSHVDLSKTKGLAEIKHEGPSHIVLDTIQLPQGGTALHFLQGTGIPDEWIDFWRATMMHPIQYHSLFISYSSKDEMLARRLHADLQAKGVRCWFAPEDLKIGDRFHSRINEAIHLQDKLLLLLSKSAIQSDWVEVEVRAALEKERRQHRDVLFPVRLDNSVMETSQAWAAMLRQSRHISDFTRWTYPQAYQQAFDRLLRDLKKADEQQDQEMKR